MKDTIITILLLAIIIALTIFVGFFGYTVYSEITGKEKTPLNQIFEEVGISSKKSIIVTGVSEQPKPLDSPDIPEVNPTKEKKDTIGGKNLYNQLDDNAKKIYIKLIENKENLKTGKYKIEFGNMFSNLLSKEGGDELLQKQYQSAIEAFIYENPDVFYIDATNMYINIEKITKITGTKYNVYINQGHKTSYLSEGLYSKEEVDKCEQEIIQVKNQILSELSGDSDYEKILKIHDYLIDTIEYDSSVSKDNIYNIYGALVSKKCVCEGYAKAFQYLLTEAGIDNIIVIGSATNSKDKTESHAWNYVKINDNWYAVDVTWDDPIIIGGGKLTKDLKYQYFLKGKRTMTGNHVISNTFTEGGQEFEYPELNETDYKK